MNIDGKNKKAIAGLSLVTLLIGSGSVFAANSMTAGPQADNTGIASNGWYLTPAGKQLTLGDFPMGSAVSPDQQYLVVSNDGQGTQSLQVVDLKQQKVVQTLPFKSPEALYLGVTFSPDGKKLYASAGGNNKVRVFTFENATLTEQTPILLKDAANTNYYPAGITVSPDGKFLYTTNNVNNSVSRVDLSNGQITAPLPVGKNPYMPLLSKDGSTLYVTNWGENSVSVLDAKDFSMKKTITVGLHPNAITENPKTGFVYVANSDSDEISTIDPKENNVVNTISLAPYHGAQTGSQPDALTISPDGKTLYVANAGNNDIAVIDLNESKMKGLIPTAWYPTGVQVSADGKNLLVLNAKGLGAGPNTDKQYIGNMIKGTMSFIEVPDNEQVSKYTKQVKENNHTADAKQGGVFSRWSDQEFPIPRTNSQHSPVKHVIYVIKENRTYDQVFGDLGKGNGDASLTMFGNNITPNLHKLANQFVTLDNFYADAEISAQGHNWATAAKSNDYTEKNWLANYSGRNRGYDFEGDNEAAYSAAGHIWNNAARSRVSFRDYGEFVNYDSDKAQWVPADPSIGNNYDPQFAGWNMDISDVTRADEWAKEYHQFEQNGNLPQFSIVRLPNDHTAGTKPGKLTPQAMVAQNDYALGKLVDTVSHSSYWKDTAIFVTEDDAQNGYDHVDAHRTESLVISPFTQTGQVDSTFYNTSSMIKTMEMILGMKPMTQYDAAATPMLNSFTNHPNFTTYSIEQPQYPLDQKNGQNAPAAQISQKMDFSKEDAASSEELNRVLWKSTKGDQPLPTNGNK